MWPQGVCWLNDVSRVRPALGRGVRDTATAAVAAVSGHLRERSGKPVQTHPARRVWRSDEGQRCRAVHALRKPTRRTISPAPLSLGMGTGSALGWINLTTCDSSGASFGPWSCRPSPFGDPRGSILRVPSAMGFNPAFGCATVSGVRIGGFTSRAVADGAEASTADVRIRVLNWCFGVSMVGR